VVVAEVVDVVEESEEFLAEIGQTIFGGSLALHQRDQSTFLKKVQGLIQRFAVQKLLIGEAGFQLDIGVSQRCPPKNLQDRYRPSSSVEVGEEVFPICHKQLISPLTDVIAVAMSIFSVSIPRDVVGP
jgi:hypothetical protein